MNQMITLLRRELAEHPASWMVPAVLGGGLEDSSGEPVAPPAAILSSDDLKEVIPAVERLIIDRVLRRTTGNQSKAARILNLSRGALIAKIKEMQIEKMMVIKSGQLR